MIKELPLTKAHVPNLKRRLICMVYEGMLLFGITFVAGLIFDVSTQSRHALMLRHVRELWLFLVIGIYFVFFWSRSGQTLAMQTWRIRVVDNDGGKLPVLKAIVRYCLAWMWFLPGLAIAYQLDLKSWTSVSVVIFFTALWASTAVFSKDKQFLHDKLAKTRLIQLNAGPSKIQ